MLHTNTSRADDKDLLWRDESIEKKNSGLNVFI